MNDTRQCPLCNNLSPLTVGLVKNSRGIHRVQCAKCGLLYFDKTNYKRPEYNLEYNTFFFRSGDIRKAGIMAALIADIVKEKLGDARILEIGPGNGLTAFLLKQQKFDVEVIDDDWKACRRIIKDYGIKAWPGKFEESRFAPTFDFVYAGHVIEHSEDPRQFFLKARYSLKDGGLFFFDMPDTHYARKHGLNWKHFNTRNPYEHCCLFSMQTVEYIAKATGFEVVSRVNLTEFESMQILLRKV